MLRCSQCKQVTWETVCNAEHAILQGTFCITLQTVWDVICFNVTHTTQNT